MTTTPPENPPEATPKLSLLSLPDAKKAGKQLAEQINALSDKAIGNIKDDTLTALKALMGATSEVINLGTKEETGKNLLKFFAKITNPNNSANGSGLTRDARQDIHDTILSNISPTITLKTPATSGANPTPEVIKTYSIADSLADIKHKLLNTNEDKAKAEADEAIRTTNEATEKTKDEKKQKEDHDKAEHAKLSRSDRIVKFTSSGEKLESIPEEIGKWAMKDTPQKAIGTLAGTLGATGALVWLGNGAQTFLTNFPIVADYANAITNAAYGVMDLTGMSAALNPYVAPVVLAAITLPAIGAVKRWAMKKAGVHVTEYESNIAAFLGNSGEALKLLYEIPLGIPFIISKVGTEKFIESKAWKPSVRGVAAAVIGGALAPFTGGTTIALGTVGYFGGNFLAHNSKNTTSGVAHDAGHDAHTH